MRREYIWIFLAFAAGSFSQIIPSAGYVRDATDTPLDNGTYFLNHKGGKGGGRRGGKGGTHSNYTSTALHQRSISSSTWILINTGLTISLLHQTGIVPLVLFAMSDYAWACTDVKPEDYYLVNTVISNPRSQSLNSDFSTQTTRERQAKPQPNKFPSMLSRPKPKLRGICRMAF